MAKKTPGKKDEFAELRERFSLAADRWSDDRKRYKEDSHFLYVDHWPEGVKRERQSQIDPRLCLEIDQLSQYVRQVINDSRQNRPQIKVRPVDSGADVETAEVFDGLFRHWQEASNADTCYDVALESACVGGFGYFRILHDYIHNKTFEQDFRFSPVINPLTVYYGDHKEPDGSDAKECWIVEEIPIDDYKKEYPDSKPESWEGEGSRYGDWGGEKIRVAELYEIRNVPTEMHMLADGTVVTAEEYQDAAQNGVTVPEIISSRTIPQKELWWSKFNGAEYLEEPRKEPGDRIPVFPVWGNTQNIDGKVRHISMIHKSKDAQLLYDYAQTAFAERVGQTPEAPWVAAAGQVENHLDNWDGTRRVRVQLYDPVDINGQAIPPPQRQNPSDIPAGFAQTMVQAEHGIQASLGMYSASIGRKGNATSGIQEQEQARKGDVSSFHYHDNLSRAIRSAGRYLVSAAPEVLDTARVVRILGLDGTPQTASLDPNIEGSVQKTGANSIFNLGVGVYDVAVDTGPSYQTSRQASAAGMLSLAQADPAMWQTHGDLIAEAQDWPEAQRFAARSKMLLPPQVAQAEMAGNENQQVQMAMAQVEKVQQEAQQAITQRDEALNKLQMEMIDLQTELAKTRNAAQQKIEDEERKAMEARIQAVEIQLSEREVDIKEYEAETERLNVEATIRQNEITALKDEAVKAMQRISGENGETFDMGGMDVEPTSRVKRSTMTEGEQTMVQAAQAMIDAVGQLAQIITAPRLKQATAVKQKDGSFVLQSIETVSQQPEEMLEQSRPETMQ